MLAVRRIAKRIPAARDDSEPTTREGVRQEDRTGPGGRRDGWAQGVIAMFRRVIWLFLLLLATQFASGCCYYMQRPFLFRRWDAGCCGSTSCCGAEMSTPFRAEYGGPPPLAPAGPNMPPAATLTRR